MSKPKILFICTHNSARSQMAEGLLRNMYDEKYEACSAGTNPTTINPLAIKAMAKIGIDISDQYSKGLEAFSDTEIDLTVSVCESSTKTLCTLCTSPLTMDKPLVVGVKLPKTKKYVVQGFEDPSEVCGTEAEKLDAFCRIRDEIKTWITDYFTNLKMCDTPK
ncbi:MAG: arsenate reductase ArsC [Nitrososphaerota archaeon]|nr:arsenate reductase ArsC [Nitrososphaerota archaeon]